MKSKLLVALLLTCSLVCACGKDKDKNVADSQVGNENQSVSDTDINGSRYEEGNEIIAIEVDTSSIEKEYVRGDVFNESDISVLAVYANGETKQLTKSEYDISEVNMSVCGPKEITVTCGNLTKSFTITINSNIIDFKPIEKYTTSKLNLREGPGTEFDVLKSVAAGTKLDVIGIADNNWVKVSYQKKEYYCSDDYLTEDAPAIDVKLDFVDGTIIVKEDGAKQEAVDKAIAMWKATPSKVKNLLTNNLWEIYVSGTDLRTRFNYDSKISGATIAQLSSNGEFKYDSGSIYLANNPSEIAEIFYYELGHAIDYTNGLISGQSEFQAIFRAEREKLELTSPINTKYKTSETEYFAILVKEIIEGNTSVEEQVPDSYAFVSKYVK